MRTGSITTTRDFRHAVSRGRRERRGAVVVHVIERPEATSPSRLGVAVDGAVRPATVRNRIKRRIREAWRACGSEPGRDVVVRVRGAAEAMDFQKLVEDMKEALARAEAGLK